jgi:riboflavin synthase
LSGRIEQDSSANYQAGDTVNVEVDMMGKYVLGSAERLEAMVERIVDRRLRERGL